jgi:hypothetical protein
MSDTDKDKTEEEAKRAKILADLLAVTDKTITSTSTTTTSDHIAINPHWNTGHTYQTYPGTVYPNTSISYPQPQDPWAQLVDIDGLDELCEMLGVEEGGQLPYLRSRSGKSYSLLSLLRAQVEMMTKLTVLLVHRNIGAE